LIAKILTILLAMAGGKLPCCPTKLEYLTIGYLWSEGLIESKDEIKEIKLDKETRVARVKTEGAVNVPSKPLIASGGGRSITAFSAQGCVQSHKQKSQPPRSSPGWNELKQEYPHAKVVVHPECLPGVIAIADEVLSTDGLCRYASRSEVREIIVGTESRIIHRLRKENPGKKFIPASEQATCPNMKSTA
jgi:hypothetical protein